MTPDYTKHNSLREEPFVPQQPIAIDIKLPETKNMVSFAVSSICKAVVRLVYFMLFLSVLGIIVDIFPFMKIPSLILAIIVFVIYFTIAVIQYRVDMFEFDRRFPAY